MQYTKEICHIDCTGATNKVTSERKSHAKDGELEQHDSEQEEKSKQL